MLPLKSLLAINLVAAACLSAAATTPPATAGSLLQPAAAATPVKSTRPRQMVALVFGQSNAANFGEGRYTAGPAVYNLADGRLYRARDPLRGANGETGSVWGRLADKLIAGKLYDSVILAPVAVGGTEIARWAPDGDLHKLVLKAIEGAQKRKLKFTHLLWHQGESDAVLFTSQQDYQARFRAMLASIRQHGVDAPVFVAVATRCGKYPVSPDIQQAQQGLVDPSQGIYPGPNTDLLDETWRYDGCHFSTAGLDMHANLWLQQLKQYPPLQETMP